MTRQTLRAPRPRPIRTVEIAKDFHGCRIKLDDIGLADVVKRLISDSGFTVMESVHHQFDGAGGFTQYVIIGESGVGVHTWPETDTVHFTVHFCNFTENHFAKCRRLYSLFRRHFVPVEVVAHPSRIRLVRAARTYHRR